MTKWSKLIAFSLMTAMAIAAQASPAHPASVNVAQPDGDSLALSLKGDEYYHFNTTSDGYTVVQANGRWEYAVKHNGRLTSSGVMAHNPSRRTLAETQLLATLQLGIIDDQARSQSMQARAKRDKQVKKEPVVDYSAFRGLIVLINFNDKQFGMSNPYDFYDKMSNKKDYEGFYTTNSYGGQRLNRCTGSVRDYFFDQSAGQFEPEFDIAGPVNVPFSCRECGNDYGTIFKAALDSIDEYIDFTRYDSDQNGEVDMVFFLVAGYAASYSGNSSDYLWPHMSYLYGFDPETYHYFPLIYDDMYMGRYASSTEIYGWEQYGSTMPNGIGTICHEFSHVLGLPDLYDTDYAEGGGQSNDPGEWDVMAGGSYGNYGRTPVGYSLWERAELGWTEPEVLELGHYEMQAIHKSNAGYIMRSPVEEEMFYVENRQREKWDTSLPSHGMLVARVDYSNPRVWYMNDVNTDPAHNYYELVRAGGTAESTTFPGEAGKTELNATSNPQLVTWGGMLCEYGFENIAETNGIISFDVSEGPEMGFVVEDFETMAATTDKMLKGVPGRFATWDFIQANVSQDSIFGEGQGCEMAMPSGIHMTTDVDADIYMVSVMATNTSSQDSKLQLSYSVDEGASWVAIGTEVASANATSLVTWRFSYKEPVRFRMTRTAGNKNALLYVDDFSIHYTGEMRPVYVKVRGDLNGDGIVDVTDVAMLTSPQPTSTVTDRWM